MKKWQELSDSNREPYYNDEYENKRLAFIPVPKCASESLKNFIIMSGQKKLYLSPEMGPDGEPEIPGLREKFKAKRPHPRCTPGSGRPYFSVVRNPFAWLVSLWFWNWPAGGGGVAGGPGHGGPNVRAVWKKWERFVYEFNSHNTSPNRYWNELGFHKSVPMFSLRHLQTCQTFDKLDVPGKKQSHAECYIRIERLMDGLSALDIKQKKVPRLNETRLKRKYEDYRRYYTTQMIDHVTAHRRQELKLLGYDFEGPTDDLAVFKIVKPFMWCSDI